MRINWNKLHRRSCTRKALFRPSNVIPVILSFWCQQFVPDVLLNCNDPNFTYINLFKNEAKYVYNITQIWMLKTINISISIGKLKTLRFHLLFHNHTKLAIIGIIAKFVLPYTCSFLLLWDIIMLVSVKLNDSGNKWTAFQGSFFHWYGWYQLEGSWQYWHPCIAAHLWKCQCQFFYKQQIH